MNVHIAASSLDGDLIALGTEFEKLRDQYFTALVRYRLYRSYQSERGEDLLDARAERVSAVVRCAARLPISSIGGLKVKARMAEWESENLWVPDQLATALKGRFAESMILWSIVSDLLNAPERA